MGERDTTRVEFDSSRTAESWDFLASVYDMSVRSDSAPGHLRFRRDQAGAVAVDEVELASQVVVHAGPFPRLVVVEVHQGRMELARERGADRIGAGGVAALAEPGEECRARAGPDLAVRLTSIDPADLVVAASAQCGHDVEEVRLTSLVPVSGASAWAWRLLVDKVQASMRSARSPIAADALAQLLAQAAVITFPNDVWESPTELRRDRDRGAGSPPAVRRAVAFIEANAGSVIGVAEIARAARVGQQGLQTAFRQHLGTTPLGYLRRVRLDLVRSDLLAGDGRAVAEIAGRWGFFDLERFTALYRGAYGESPAEKARRRRDQS